MCNPKKKISEQTKLKQSHRYRKQLWSPGGRGVGGLAEGGKRTKKHKLMVTKESQGCKVHRNTVDNMVITVYTARWVLETSKGTICKVYDCLTTMNTPETNTKQY